MLALLLLTACEKAPESTDLAGEYVFKHNDGWEEIWILDETLKYEHRLLGNDGGRTLIHAEMGTWEVQKGTLQMGPLIRFVKASAYFEPGSMQKYEQPLEVTSMDASFDYSGDHVSGLNFGLNEEYIAARVR